MSQIQIEIYEGAFPSNHRASWIYRRVCHGNIEFWYRHTIRIEKKEISGNRVMVDWRESSVSWNFACTTKYYILYSFENV